ncbi:MAG: hypothetical protein RBJ76_12965 [Stenomitos frigidus ULC029]
MAAVRSGKQATAIAHNATAIDPSQRAIVPLSERTQSFQRLLHFLQG